MKKITRGTQFHVTRHVRFPSRLVSLWRRLNVLISLMLVLYVAWPLSMAAGRQLLSFSFLTDMGPRTGLCISLFIPKKKRNCDAILDNSITRYRGWFETRNTAFGPITKILVSLFLCTQFQRKLLSNSAVAQWLRCCATNRKVAGSIPAGVSGFFIAIILPIALRPWGRLSL